MATAGRRAGVLVTAVLAALAWPSGVPNARSLRVGVRSAAEEPSLATVLARVANYVGEFSERLAGIVAEETYIQEVKTSSARSRLGTNRGGGLPRRVLKSDVLLVKPIDADRYVEFRDVFEVDGTPVRNREDRLTKLFLDPTANADQMRRIVLESARYNIGEITRTMNTPMLPLMFLLEQNQRRFKFKRASGIAELATLTVGGTGGSPTFRLSTQMWVIEFRETRKPTIIRTDAGRDFPAAGRYWVDPDTGAVLMTELVMEGSEVRGVVDVSYQSERLLGFNVPVQMREQYRARYDHIVGVATYDRFRRFQVRTEENIDLPPVTPKKPPAR